MPTVTRIPIFGQLEVDVIVRLCQMLNTLPALEGSPVILQGRVATEMYIINSGRLQVPLILLSHSPAPSSCSVFDPSHGVLPATPSSDPNTARIGAASHCTDLAAHMQVWETPPPATVAPMRARCSFGGEFFWATVMDEERSVTFTFSQLCLSTQLASQQHPPARRLSCTVCHHRLPPPPHDPKPAGFLERCVS